MYKIFRLTSIISVFILAALFNIYADTRTENIELYLVIDKSKSMVEEISDVSEYINRTFVEDFLIAGDRLVLIQFYGKADLVYDGRITISNKKEVMRDISNIPADGRFTDIGNALDRLRRAVVESETDGRRKYLILLTDGKQEAPPESPYYTPDGSFNHEFLLNTKVIQKAGWKVMILGIGQDTVVEELADELGTTHEVLDFEGGTPAIKNPDEIIGRILASGFSIENSIINLSLKSEGYTSDRTITVDQILYQAPSGNYKLLNKAWTSQISPDSETEVSIRLSEDALKELSGNNAAGSILFNFSGDTPFLPAVFDSVLISYNNDSSGEKSGDKISEKSSNDMNKDFNWLIIVIVILVVAAVIAIIIIRNLVFHREDDDGSKNKKDEISIDS